ncbi:rab-GTPase-TBC domain-containing protein [Lipomyces kononenkoae]|uniref:Rab-GTPase-TBC domain-containing protein n=1 Tax=Lipomyces kononenkoae TaxID=34357 RepID=A0ACC3T5G9_LIPKO
MSSKKFSTHQEMVQLVGRNTAAATFLRSAVRQQSAQGYRPVLSDDPKPYGSGYSHADILRASSKSKTESTFAPRHDRNISYTDLDDDWDANFETEVMGLGMNPNARPVSPPDPVPLRPQSPITVVGQDGPEPRSSSPRVDQLYPTSRRATGTAGGLKPHYERIVKDPANSLHMIYHPSVSSSSSSTSSVDNASAAEIELLNARISRINKFKRVLQSSNVDISALRNLAWSGIPDELRPMSWQVLLGYLPSNADRRVSTLARKRREYADGVKQAFANGVDHAVWHQINIDVPRTNPHLKLYSFEATQRSLERILYVWAIRHPASGYVQGINDLVTPFFQVFLSAYVDGDVESYDPGLLPKEVLDVVEADSFWCLTKLLDGIQDNYIFAQPGIQRQVAALKDLTMRIDANLARHLQAENVEFIQFSFRWMNCLLMREVSVKNTIRMWDTYMAEGSTGFSEFHLYVCAAFLVKWSVQIQTMDFQEIMMFLQSLPTQSWTEKDVELLLSEAYMWQSLFKNATAHLRPSGT